MYIPAGTKISTVKKVIKAAKKVKEKYEIMERDNIHTDESCAFCNMANNCDCFYWVWFYGNDCYEWKSKSIYKQGCFQTLYDSHDEKLHNHRIRMLKKHIAMMEQWIKKNDKKQRGNNG